MKYDYKYNIKAIQEFPDSQNNLIPIDEVKSFLKINSSASDSLVSFYVKVAIQSAERQIQSCITKKRFLMRLTKDQTTDVIHIPTTPFISVFNVLVDDIQTNYQVSDANVMLDFSVLPTIYRKLDIVFDAGYESSIDLSHEIKFAILNHILYMWDSDNPMVSTPQASMDIYKIYNQPNVKYRI